MKTRSGHACVHRQVVSSSSGSSNSSGQNCQNPCIAHRSLHHHDPRAAVVEERSCKRASADIDILQSISFNFFFFNFSSSPIFFGVLLICKNRGGVIWVENAINQTQINWLTTSRNSNSNCPRCRVMWPSSPHAWELLPIDWKVGKNRRKAAEGRRQMLPPARLTYSSPAAKLH